MWTQMVEKICVMLLALLCSVNLIQQLFWTDLVWPCLPRHFTAPLWIHRHFVLHSHVVTYRHAQHIFTWKHVSAALKYIGIFSSQNSVFNSWEITTRVKTHVWCFVELGTKGRKKPNRNRFFYQMAFLSQILVYKVPNNISWKKYVCLQH